tara:strand:+ start:48931 stop:49890 length:960 start_codon:yes stop_codon:yes gene_type:complete
MEVIVLVGGFGTRLRPWTENRAKPLLPILDKNLLERVIEVIPEDLISKVIIAAGYGVEQIEEFFSKKDTSYEIIISTENEPLGTGGAVGLASKNLTKDGPVIVLNGDLISSVDIKSLLNHHYEKEAKATLSLWEVEDPSRFGVCDLDNDGYIRRFQEKPDPGTEFSNYINAGCVIIEKEILDNFSLERHSMERVVFPTIAESGQMAGLLFTGYFVDAGTPQSYIEAVQTCIDNDRFNSGKKINQSWFADDVEKMESVKRCSIGANVSIDPSASLTDCVVLNNAIIGKNTFLDSCLIGEGAIIKDGIVISEEVIGHRATR